MPGRILIVDSLATNRVVLKTRLMAEYYDVHLVSDAKSAWVAIPSYLPDIIMINSRLSDGDGYALCSRIKSHCEFGHTPVVMIAPSQDEVDWKRAYSCYADDIQELPLDFPILHPRLQSLLRSKASLDEMRLRTKTSASLGLSEPAATFYGKSEATTPLAILCSYKEDDLDYSRDLNNLYNTDAIQVFVHTEGTNNISQETLVIMADSMGPNALKLLSDLRGSPQHRHKTILYACSENRRRDARKAFELGANDIIFSPFDINELALRTRALANHAASQKSMQDTFDKSLQLAAIDPLTGLHNRRYAMQYLTTALDQAQKTDTNLIAMMFDIDQFKLINDSHGHSMGDFVLSVFAQRLKTNLRGVDLIARMGGEEFLVVIPRVSNERAQHLAERLRAVVAETPFIDPQSNRRANVTVSIGLAAAVPKDDSCKLLDRADTALYQSKKSGRDQVTFHSQAA